MENVQLWLRPLSLVDQNLLSIEESRGDTSSYNERSPAWRDSADHVRDPADELNTGSDLPFHTEPGTHLKMRRVEL